MTNKASGRRAAFADCYRALNKVVEAKEPLRMEFDTPGKAINFRQRCYRARSIMYQRSVAQVGEALAETPWDAVVIRIESQTPKGGSDQALIFDLREEDVEMTTLDGKPVETIVEPDFDDLPFDDIME